MRVSFNLATSRAPSSPPLAGGETNALLRAPSASRSTLDTSPRMPHPAYADDDFDDSAGIKVLPSIINACLLTSAWSAASSDLYTSSRALYGLALNGQAPAFLKKTNRWGLPYYCIAVGVAFSLLSYMSAGSKSAGTVFNYFANVSLFTFFIIVYNLLTKVTPTDDLGLRSPHLVGNLPHVDSLLRRTQGSGYRPQDAALPRAIPTIPRVLRPHFLYVYPHSLPGQSSLTFRAPQPRLSSSSTAGRCSSTASGTPRPLSPPTSRSYVEARSLPVLLLRSLADNFLPSFRSGSSRSSTASTASSGVAASAVRVSRRWTLSPDRARSSSSRTTRRPSRRASVARFSRTFSRREVPLCCSGRVIGRAGWRASLVSI